MKDIIPWHSSFLLHYYSWIWISVFSGLKKEYHKNPLVEDMPDMKYISKIPILFHGDF